MDMDRRVSVSSCVSTQTKPVDLQWMHGRSRGSVRGQRAPVGLAVAVVVLAVEALAHRRNEI